MIAIFNNNLLKLLFFVTISIIITFDLSYSKNLKLSGLNKLSLGDIQTLSVVDIFSNSLSDNEMSILIKELKK